MEIKPEITMCCIEMISPNPDRWPKKGVKLRDAACLTAAVRSICVDKVEH